MATSLRDLRRKIRSTTSTQKITSAMQLVAASKMQRAVRQATDSRSYTEGLKTLTDRLTSSVSPDSQPLFAVRPIKRALLLLVTTNRGLAGALNTQLFRSVFAWRDQQEKQGRDLQIIAVGAKGRAYTLRFARETLLADFSAPDAVPTFADVVPISRLMLDEFLANRSQAVFVAYNHFKSALRQEPTITQYLPFQSETKEPTAKAEESTGDELVFEPSREAVLGSILPRVLRITLYQILLEAYASEQSARMVAMKSATDNAGDLLEDLHLTANSVRQANITGELLDIAAGAAALEG